MSAHGELASDPGRRSSESALLTRLSERLTAGDDSLLIGIDGRGGSGKSTLAGRVADYLTSAGGASLSVTVIDGDDFYTGGSAASWDRRSAAQNAKRVIDWCRQHDVLERLRSDGVARWHPFDWDAEHWDSDVIPFSPTPTSARVARVIVLEGTYSCRPELHDLLDLRVLIDVPASIRHQRILDREQDDFDAAWHARWEAAEDHYFATVMPPERFDVIVTPEVR